MMNRLLILLIVALCSPAPARAQDDGFRTYRVGCGQEYSHPDYHVSHTYRDGYTQARVWFDGEAHTVVENAGFQIGGNTATTFYTAPDGQQVIIWDYPQSHYDRIQQVDDCAPPVDDTDDAAAVDAGDYDEATGQAADVYIFTDYYLGELTEIPASVDEAGNLHVILQADKWYEGQRYAVFTDGVYRGTFVLGGLFGELNWEAA